MGYITKYAIKLILVRDENERIKSDDLFLG